MQKLAQLNAEGMQDTCRLLAKELESTRTAILAYKDQASKKRTRDHVTLPGLHTATIIARVKDTCREHSP